MFTPVSLVTVSYNSAEVLTACWSGDLPGVEWIVVDNNSADDTVAVARSLGAKVIGLPRNVGFSGANNIGAGQATGNTLIFCNPDVTVTQEGVAKLVEFAQARECLVAPQLVNEDGSLQENGRGAPYPYRKARHLLLRGSPSEEDSYSRLARGDEVIPVVWVMGAAVAVQRKIFERIGGWDDSYFIYYEDADLCLRAWDLGIPTYVDGSVRWRHGWARETARGLSWRAWKHEFASAARFYLTHRYCLIPIGRRGRRMRARDRDIAPAASPRP